MIREEMPKVLPQLRIWVATPSYRVWKKFVRSGDACASYREITQDAVTDQVCEPLRPGVFAMWSDPRERLGLAALVLLVAVTSACASMPTKQNRARAAATIALAAHPELTDIRASLDRLEALVDTLTERVAALDVHRAADREGHREDLEAVLRSVRGWVDELKAAVEKGR